MRPAWIRYAGVALGLALCVGALAGCGRPGSHAGKAVEPTAQASEQWMHVGTYAPVSPELRQKVSQALDAIETQTAYTFGLYTQTATQELMQIEGELHGQGLQLSLQQGSQGQPAVCYLLQDRFYSPQGDDLLDHGPNSRGQGEKLYLPQYRDLRISIRQALNGEAKDVGPGTFDAVPVHKVDLRLRLPGPTAGLLTATLEIDDAHGWLRHAVLGEGNGSDSAQQRFRVSYRELVLDKFGEVPEIKLPAGVKIVRPEEQPDINQQKLGLE